MHWKSDLGNGKYKNPILYCDYSDPDAIRVGDDYFMVASSFCNSPALPLLHSYDLVNWKVVNYVCKKVPGYRYVNPMHGCGVWAPAIRYHNDEFYVYFPMPDEGIFVCRTKDPYGEWSEPFNIMPECGVIDPCPFWDDDGRAYLITAVAGSRKGYKSVLRLSEMAPDGMSLKSDPVIIYDGRGTENETIEGPKLYKKDGLYYIFAPAGGVKGGFQVVLRSDKIYGPYKYRIVMRQGSSKVNGPHQGAWVDTAGGQDWFIHFQDVYACGRIVHLQPMEWRDGWPLIGQVRAGNDYGEPVAEYDKPDINVPDEKSVSTGAEANSITADAESKGRSVEIGSNSISVDNESKSMYDPVTSDEFESDTLGLQWQWNANYEDDWYELFPERSVIRLNAVRTNSLRQLPDYRNLLLQKWAAPEFSFETKIDLKGLKIGDIAGIVSMGQIFGSVGIQRTIRDGMDVYEVVKIHGRQEFDHEMSFADSTEEIVELDTDRIKAAGLEAVFSYEVKIRGYEDHLDRIDAAGNEIWVKNVPGETISMSVSIDGENVVGSELVIDAMAGRWVGVKSGLFCVHRSEDRDCGYAEADYVRYI